MRQVTVSATIASEDEVPTYSTLPVIIDQYQDPAAITFYTDSGGSVKISYADPFPVVNGDFVEQTSWDWQAPVLNAYPNGANFIGQPIRAIYLEGAAQGDLLTVIQAGVKG